MAIELRRTGSARAAPALRRAWLAFLVGAIVVAGCAQPHATADSGASSRSVSAAQPAHSADPTTARHDPTTVAIQTSCPVKGYPLVSLWTGYENWTTAVGKIIGPGAPDASKAVAGTDDRPAMVYGEFDAEIDRVLAGPRLGPPVRLSFQGGRTDEIVTDVGREFQSAWADDGSFIGLVRAASDAPTGWIADTLPVVDGRVVFPGRVGCFEPAGLQDVDERPVSVLVFDNGTVIESSGLFPTASLAEITRELGQ